MDDARRDTIINDGAGEVKYRQLVVVAETSTQVLRARIQWCLADVEMKTLTRR